MNSFRPMNRRDHWTEVTYGSSVSARPVARRGRLDPKRLKDRLAVPAEEHPGADRDRSHLWASHVIESACSMPAR